MCILSGTSLSSFQSLCPHLSTVCPLSCFDQSKMTESSVAYIFPWSDYMMYNYSVFKVGLTGLSGSTHISPSVLLSHSYYFGFFFPIKILYVINFINGSLANENLY